MLILVVNIFKIQKLPFLFELFSLCYNYGAIFLLGSTIFLHRGTNLMWGYVKGFNFNFGVHKGFRFDLWVRMH
jgi:hypothetical protein